MTTEFTPAKEENVSDPLPLDSNEEAIGDESHRIWIGNVDPSLNEFGLLQLLKRFGTIKHLDFLFHKSGPNKGKSRGFHFASYCSKQNAEKAIAGLNGKHILRKTIQVRWAHQQIPETSASVNTNLKTSSDGVKSTKRADGASTKSAMIQSIEQKLSEMENTSGTKSYGASGSVGLHPLLQQSKVNAEAAAMKRFHPYKKFHGRKRYR